MKFLDDDDEKYCKGGTTAECDPDGQEGKSNDNPRIVAPDEPRIVPQVTK